MNRHLQPSLPVRFQVAPKTIRITPDTPARIPHPSAPAGTHLEFLHRYHLVIEKLFPVITLRPISLSTNPHGKPHKSAHSIPAGFRSDQASAINFACPDDPSAHRPGQSPFKHPHPTNRPLQLGIVPHRDRLTSHLPKGRQSEEPPPSHRSAAFSRLIELCRLRPSIASSAFHLSGSSWPSSNRSANRILPLVAISQTRRNITHRFSPTPSAYNLRWNAGASQGGCKASSTFNQSRSVGRRTLRLGEATPQRISVPKSLAQATESRG